MKSNLIIAVVFFCTGYFFAHQFKPSAAVDKILDKDISTVERGDLAISIRESGTIKARKSTIIRSGIKRSVKLIFIVPEGSRIKKGETLFKLDTKETKNEIKNIQQKIRAAEAKLETSQGNADIEKIEGDNKVSKAKLDLEEADKNLEKYLNGELPLAEREKKVKLEEATSNLKRVQEKLKRMPKLLEEGFVTSDRMEQEKINLKKSQVEFDTAKSELELLLKYTKPLEIEKRKAAISKAKSQLNAHKKQIAAKLKQKQVEMDSLKLEIENHRLELDNLQQELKKMEGKAPTDGLVIYENPSGWRRGYIEVGKEVSPHDDIITLPDLSQMQVQLKVHETNVRQVKVGMPASIIVEAAGDLSTQGTVTKVAEIANSRQSWMSDSEVKEFDVEITLNKKKLGLKPGTSAKVELLTHSIKGAIFVRVKAIRAVENQTFCYIVKDKKLERRFVKIGKSNDEYVEVQSGLKEGEQVFIGKIPKEMIAEEETIRREQIEVDNEKN